MNVEASRTGKAAEFGCLYLGIPVLLRLMPEISRATGVKLSIPIVPALLVMSGFVLTTLLRTTDFKVGDLFTASSATRRDWLHMLGRFALLATILSAVLAVYRPDALLRLPRERPHLWMMVMFFYPIASVIPQGIVYRAFYKFRYSKLFPVAFQTLVGAAIFSFAHLPFANPFAITFTFAGGLMFLASYKRTGSLLLSSLEHALYGDFIFTIGWGQYFFHAGTLRLMEQLQQ